MAFSLIVAACSSTAPRAPASGPGDNDRGHGDFRGGNDRRDDRDHGPGDGGHGDWGHDHDGRGGHDGHDGRGDWDRGGFEDSNYTLMCGNDRGGPGGGWGRGDDHRGDDHRDDGHWGWGHDGWGRDGRSQGDNCRIMRRPEERVMNVYIDRDFSRFPCIEGRNWRWNDDWISVDEGCRAQFRVQLRGPRRFGH